VKTALILTTINIPTVLSLYRAHDPDVRFFVAMDKKTPGEAYRFCNRLPNCVPIVDGNVDLVTFRDRGGYACSDLIGWNTISRRNIALLEALKWGADVIVSIDDDNIPLDTCYFWHYECSSLASPFNGIKVKPAFYGWFDPGHLQFTRVGDTVVQRGFPQAYPSDFGGFTSVTGAKIGVAQGMILGDPDTSAVDRISRHPQVHQVSELLRAGIVTDPRETYAPLNSQNIAFIRELAPCFFMVPQWQRFDDIYAGLVAQRVMRDRGYFVHYGQPFVWQQRNPHDLLKDLAAEQWGAEHILDFTAWLDGFTLPKQVPAVEAMKIFFTNLPDFIPERGKLQELALAWCSDIEGVMR
jgi:hypothetical protein